MTPFDCPTCKGKGGEGTCVQCERPWGDGEPCGLESYEAFKPCSSCGGSGIDPELVEVAAKVVWKLTVPPHNYEANPWDEAHPLNRERVLRLVRGVLAALVAYWKEKE